MHPTSAVTRGGVDEQIDDNNEDLARWLQEVAGRRPSAPLGSESASHQRPKASGDDLINYLQELTGRKYASREDINDFFKQLQAEEVGKNRAATHRRIIREILLLACLLVSYLQYYYWDVNLQIASLRGVQVYVPVREDPYRVPGTNPKPNTESTRM